MAIFFDFHPAGEVPVEAVRHAFAEARRGRTDRSGCQPLDYYLASPGSVYCILEAPSEAAVRQFHADRGMSCSRVVRPVGGTPRGWPLAEADQAVLQRVLARHWQATGQPDAAPPGELAG
jgi:Protein of unknown function (DUF4242)